MRNKILNTWARQPLSRFCYVSCVFCFCFLYYSLVSALQPIAFISHVTAFPTVCLNLHSLLKHVWCGAVRSCPNMLASYMYVGMPFKKKPWWKTWHWALTHLVTKGRKNKKNNNTTTWKPLFIRNAPISLCLCEYVCVYVCECPSLLEWLSMQLKQEQNRNK